MVVVNEHPTKKKYAFLINYGHNFGSSLSHRIEQAPVVFNCAQSGGGLLQRIFGMRTVLDWYLFWRCRSVWDPYMANKVGWDDGYQSEFKNLSTDTNKKG